MFERSPAPFHRRSSGALGHLTEIVQLARHRAASSCSLLILLGCRERKRLTIPYAVDAEHRVVAMAFGGRRDKPTRRRPDWRRAQDCFPQTLHIYCTGSVPISSCVKSLSRREFVKFRRKVRLAAAAGCATASITGEKPDDSVAHESQQHHSSRTACSSEFSVAPSEAMSLSMRSSSSPRRLGRGPPRHSLNVATAVPGRSARAGP